MDIKVENKDIQISNSGLPIMIDGIDGVVQQLKLAGLVKKGEFVYDRNMGVDLSPGALADNEEACKIVESCLNELLINTADVMVKVNNIIATHDIVVAECVVSDDYNNVETEVVIYENI